jgi:GNAT superfamily N-acetyltransferase
MRIRPALPADAGALGELHARAWRETYAGLLPEALRAAAMPERYIGEWRRRLARPRPGSVAWIAELAGAPVGFCDAGPTREPEALGAAGEIYGLYLLRAAQGQGIGAGLFRAATAHLTALSLFPAGCWVAEGNVRAIGFYRAMGGQPGPHRIERRPQGEFPQLAFLWPGPVPPRRTAL